MKKQTASTPSASAQLKKSLAENKALKTDLMIRKLQSENKRLAGFKNMYDSVAPSAATKRRTVNIDTQEETGAASKQLNPRTRLLAVSLCRDAARNFSYAKSMLKQIRLNVVGRCYKVQINAKNAEPAQKWFNSVYAKNADFRSDLHICDLFGLALDSVIRDGDCGQMIDINLTESGKLVYFEADQICDLDDASMKADPKMAGLTCQDGILRDGFWREVGYVLSPKKRGAVSVNATDGPYIAWRSADDFTLLRMPFRHNQGRGIPEMMACVADLVDAFEMRSKELQSAKVAASMAGKVTRKESVGNPDDPRFNPDYTGDDGAVADPVNPEAQGGAANYDRFESMLGGNLEYMLPDDDFELFKIDRPNVNMNEFIRGVVESAGTSLGLAKAYSTMAASASYSAYRGELAMSWVQFDFLQRWVERYVQDWVAIRAIRFAIEKKMITQIPEPGWEMALSWSHPKMPAIQEGSEQDGLTKAIKNADKDFSDICGADWKVKMDALAEQIEYARKKGLPLSIFESVSGAVIPDPDPGADGAGDGADGSNKNGDGK